MEDYPLCRCERGAGWVQEADDGRGLLVELHDADRDGLADDPNTTLGAMIHANGKLGVSGS